MPPSVRRPFWFASLPSEPEAQARELQRRLARLARVGFWLSTAFLLSSFGTCFIQSKPLNVGQWLHLCGTVATFVVWQAVARLPRSKFDQLEFLGGATNVSLGLIYTLMGYYLPQPNGMYTALLIGVYLSIGRAILVPSTPRVTLLVSSLALLPIPIARALSAGLTPDAMIDFTLWCLGALWLSAGTSQVIYGLQQNVLEAKRLGHYELVARLGAGGMGEVYLANHALLKRQTAIKVLLPAKSSEEHLLRFEREVQLTARLTHPNTITIFDYGRAQDGSFYYAMELVDGFSLDELVERGGPQPAARVIHLLAQVAGALEEAHAAQLIHRDVKPSNLMICERGGQLDVIKVLDFGLVRELGGGDKAEILQSHSDVITGTPMYLSPEAISAPAEVDGRSDLYALGAVGYYLITGRDVFDGNTVMDVCSKHMFAEPTEPELVLGKPVPPDLSSLLLKCLAKSPAERPQSAAALGLALKSLRDHGNWSAEDARRWWSLHPRPKRDQPIERRFIERSQLATASRFELRVG